MNFLFQFEPHIEDSSGKFQSLDLSGYVGIGLFYVYAKEKANTAFAFCKRSTYQIL